MAVCDQTAPAASEAIPIATATDTPFLILTEAPVFTPRTTIARRSAGENRLERIIGRLRPRLSAERPAAADRCSFDLDMMQTLYNRPYCRVFSVVVHFCAASLALTA